MTALRAWMFTGVFSKVAIIPSTCPDEGVSRTMRVQAMVQEEFHALGSGAVRKGSYETRTGPSIDRFSQVVGEHLSTKQSGNRSTIHDRRGDVIELDAVVQQELHGRRILIRPDTDEIAVAVAQPEIAWRGMVQVDPVPLSP